MIDNNLYTMVTSKWFSSFSDRDSYGNEQLATFRIMVTNAGSRKIVL